MSEQHPDMANTPPVENSLDLSINATFQHAATLLKTGQFVEAEIQLQQILKAMPHHAESFNLLGIIAYQTGQLDVALNQFSKAIALNPHNTDFHNNQGNIFSKLNRLDDALASYNQAISLRPNYAEAHNNRGSVLKRLHRFQESLNSYQQAIALQPNFAEAYNNLGNLYEQCHQYDVALNCFQQAIALKPQYAEAYYNQGNVFAALGQLENASTSYQQTLQIRPNYPYALGALLHCKMKLCDWRQLDHLIDALTQGIKNHHKVSAPFPVLGLIDSASLQLTCARDFTQGRFNASNFLAQKTNQANGKIRIAYYSSDFHCHATSYLIAEMLESHDKTQFEVIGFSFGLKIDDEMYQRVSASFDAFYEVANVSDNAIAEQSRALGIDIAIDLKGFTQHARMGIFAHKCAPIQVNFLGFPGTLGTDFYDYIIADNIVIPANQTENFSEKVVYLPKCYFPNDSQRNISNTPVNRPSHQLPENVFVFCCFNASYKILPSTFDIWMRLLKRIEGSVLWLLDNCPATTNHLKNEATIRGVDSSRLIFAKRLPLPEHLARHRLADLFLDTLPYNAHTTASDALWSGLPVLTCAGESFASRVAASLLLALNLPELVTDNLAAYEDNAYTLATQPGKLNAIKHKLKQEITTSALFSGKQFAKNIEQAYLAMHARSQSGLAPCNIDLSNYSP